jgi:hypothetical protein
LWEGCTGFSGDIESFSFIFLSLKYLQSGGRVLQKRTKFKSLKVPFVVGFFVLTFVLLPNNATFGQATAGQTFVEFKLKGIGTILIPDTMELQSGAYKALSDRNSSEMGYDVSGDVIFQQKGLNDFRFRDNKTYARVMIGTERDKPGSYEKLGTRIKAAPRDLQSLSNLFKKDLIDSFGATGLKLIRWDGVSIVTVNAQSALKISYLRQLIDNPSVYVEIYRFPNDDRMHSLTISYRLEDATFWKDALERTKNSFKISNAR